MRTKAFLAVLALAVVGAAAADKSDPEPPKKAPPKADVRGKVTARNELRGPVTGSILVEGKKEKDTQHDKAAVTLTAKTKFYKWVDGKKKDAKFADLEKGSIVQCVFVGGVRESYPVQANASEVLILEGPKRKK